MNLVANVDWKFVVALGASAVGIIFAVKMDADAVERVSIHFAKSDKGGTGQCLQEQIAP